MANTIEEIEDLKSKVDVLEKQLNGLGLRMLAAMAGSGISTPLEGYVKAPWSIEGDVRELRNQRDNAKKQVEELEARHDRETGAWLIQKGSQ